MILTLYTGIFSVILPTPAALVTSCCGSTCCCAPQVCHCPHDAQDSKWAESACQGFKKTTIMPALYTESMVETMRLLVCAPSLRNLDWTKTLNTSYFGLTLKPEIPPPIFG